MHGVKVYELNGDYLFVFVDFVERFHVYQNREEAIKWVDVLPKKNYYDAVKLHVYRKEIIGEHKTPVLVATYPQLLEVITHVNPEKTKEDFECFEGLNSTIKLAIDNYSKTRPNMFQEHGGSFPSCFGHAGVVFFKDRIDYVLNVVEAIMFLFNFQTKARAIKLIKKFNSDIQYHGIYPLICRAQVTPNRAGYDRMNPECFVATYENFCEMLKRVFKGKYNDHMMKFMERQAYLDAHDEEKRRFVREIADQQKRSYSSDEGEDVPEPSPVGTNVYKTRRLVNINPEDITPILCGSWGKPNIFYGKLELSRLMDGGTPVIDVNLVDPLVGHLLNLDADSDAMKRLGDHMRNFKDMYRGKASLVRVMSAKQPRYVILEFDAEEFIELVRAAFKEYINHKSEGYLVDFLPDRVRDFAKKFVFLQSEYRRLDEHMDHSRDLSAFIPGDFKAAMEEATESGIRIEDVINVDDIPEDCMETDNLIETEDAPGDGMETDEETAEAGPSTAENAVATITPEDAGPRTLE